MKWLKRLKLLRISKIVVAVSLAILILFAGFTIYGNRVGNFVVSTGGDPRLTASMREDLSDASPRLSVKGLSGQRDATYSELPKTLSQGVGNKSDTVTLKYLAFGFYLVNTTTDESLDYAMTMTVTESVGKPETIIRIMLIEGDAERGEVFAKPEATPAAAAELYRNAQYETTPFITDETLFRREVTDFRAGSRVKYTLVIWLEGYDPECVDDRIGDRIKLRLDISAYNK